MRYLGRLIENHKGDQNYARALSALAWDAYLGEDYEGAITNLTLYIAEAQPGPDKAKAQFA
ncbi:MAG: hypothetical protein GWN87_06185, partial [Desulfuromonadales bacterium]|nr:hypothetical protein [Desulfuromonadales bacterium]